MNRRKGQTLRSGAREIILNVTQRCEEEAINKAFKIPLHAPTKRAAFYTGVGETTIKKIKREHQDRMQNEPDALLKSPGKKRHRPDICEKIDDFDFQVIRRTIEDCYLVDKRVPTCQQLVAKIRQKIDFPYGRRSLNRLLKKNGFFWRKCKNKRKVPMERPQIMHWRLLYLRALKKYQNEEKSIIYIDETWVDNDMTVKKCWQSDVHKVFGVTSGIRSTGRLIVVHRGSVQGFVKKAELVFRSGTSTGDYHGQMNATNFEKWPTERLFPNIPPNSVIVLDNAPYHSTLVNKIPTTSSTKGTIMDWLRANNIPFNSSMRKVDLMQIVLQHKPLEKQYKADEIIRAHGHIPLRLPPYMCELNPIELAWAAVKRYDSIFDCFSM